MPNKTETHERFYISCLQPDSDFNKFIRDHWSVENKLHWTLDMVFREDEQRKRANHAAKNFATVRKIGLNLLKKDTGKESFNNFSDEEILKFQYKINRRPRKLLNFDSPWKVFSSALNNPVAFDT
ncbi:MAG: ISAs1 family transposase [Prevotellaceae bacterium]|nr:ISAs1 family transposase [Prevotellaceae bacterium]